jgi:hypothetical protein
MAASPTSTHLLGRFPKPAADPARGTSTESATTERNGQPIPCTAAPPPPNPQPSHANHEPPADSHKGHVQTDESEAAAHPAKPAKESKRGHPNQTRPTMADPSPQLTAPSRQTAHPITMTNQKRQMQPRITSTQRPTVINHLTRISGRDAGPRRSRRTRRSHHPNELHSNRRS